MDYGFGPWGQGANHQGGPFVDRGSPWQGYVFCEPVMDMGGPGPSFNQVFEMPPDLPPVPDRLAFHPEYDAGWHNEIGNARTSWDRTGGTYEGFPWPYDHRNARGMDDRFQKKKRKRIFSPVQPAPVKFDKKSDGPSKIQQKQSIQMSQPSTGQVKGIKQQNGKLNSMQAAKDDKTKQPINNPNTKVAPGKIEPTDGQSLSHTPSTTFTCNLCKYETPDEDEIQKHFSSKQHLEVIRHLYIFLPKQTVDFLQRYLHFERKRVFQERTRQNLQAKRDFFEGIGQEHFFHRVELAHCLACDTFIPDVPELLIEHTKSESHTQKCKTSSKEIKNNCLAMAKTMLQDEDILRLLRVYSRGRNPFEGNGQATEHIASNHEVLVAEEDDDYVSPVEDVGDADVDTNIDFTQNKEDSSLNSLPLSHSEVMESNNSNNEKVLRISDIDGTDDIDEDEEEAAEAP
ncbi:A-kinase anchor protein 8-like [Rana temporaria]|uniref:A-kinase anchor protein 8-like n=1 Tax=Rana temporaria TaxID=8407 RepID=UPI001AAE0A26|nr:A-kinase anchor protein 8-like [Rana temporaria]